MEPPYNRVIKGVKSKDGKNNTPGLAKHDSIREKSAITN